MMSLQRQPQWWAAPVGADGFPPAVVQSAEGIDNGAPASVQATLTVTEGDTLIAWTLRGGGDVGTEAISDNRGNVWLSRLDTVLSSTNVRVSQWVCLRAAGGSTTVTFTPSAPAAPMGIAVAEIRNLDTQQIPASSEHNSRTQDAPGTGQDGVTSNAVTPARRPAILVGLGCSLAGVSGPAAGASFTDNGGQWPFFALPNLARVVSRVLQALTAVEAKFTAAVDGVHVALAVTLGQRLAPWAAFHSPVGEA